MKRIVIALWITVGFGLLAHRFNADNFKSKPERTNMFSPYVHHKVELDVIPYITCEECTIQEQMALKAFQDNGITDRYALATLMGNIKQESKFLPNICEGGARVNYENCHRGGFGLIQWTTTGRYDGLGRFAASNDCNPSTTECQLGYLFTEREWNLAKTGFKTPGKSIEQYMRNAYTWLGWGIHGKRTDYAYDYTRRFSPHPGT